MAYMGGRESEVTRSLARSPAMAGRSRSVGRPVGWRERENETTGGNNDGPKMIDRHSAAVRV